MWRSLGDKHHTPHLLRKVTLGENPQETFPVAVTGFLVWPPTVVIEGCCDVVTTADVQDAVRSGAAKVQVASVIGIAHMESATIADHVGRHYA